MPVRRSEVEPKRLGACEPGAWYCAGGLAGVGAGLGAGGVDERGSAVCGGQIEGGAASVLDVVGGAYGKAGG